ncbi:hypothetical protein DV454_004626 [Geotrichum candidum]|nr:hypothetical protein DV454_004626 [Geotrichum candidum]
MVVATPEQIAQWKETKKIGIIGLGDMGQLYARKFTESGWKVCACDRESLYEETKKKFLNTSVEVVRDGHLVSRVSDFIIYSVEAANIKQIAATYGPSTKVNAIVGGQTSCKALEIEAFEASLPEDVEIITCHSLHGPRVATEGQPLVLIQHRASDESFAFVESLFEDFKSKKVYLTATEHDRITADTQAVTHAAFLSMGVAWMANNQYPWTIPKWIGGIENAKVNISLRIFSNKWHVYAGLAITNPQAHKQILQYATSTTELFKLMIEGSGDELRTRLFAARDFVFGKLEKKHSLLLSDDLLENFSLSKSPPEGPKANSHLSLLGIVDSWFQLGIIPYDHMICSTPLFRIWLGVTEYIFCTPGLLESIVDFVIKDHTFRRDDMEFVIAARSWSDIVHHGDFELYKSTFEKTQNFFKPMFAEANKLGNDMIKTILKKTEQNELENDE